MSALTEKQIEAYIQNGDWPNGMFIETFRKLLGDMAMRSLDTVSATEDSQPVAWVIQAMRDGSYMDKIAVAGWVMFDKHREKLKEDAWVRAGVAKIVPLYAAPQSAWRDLTAAESKVIPDFDSIAAPQLACARPEASATETIADIEAEWLATDGNGGPTFEHYGELFMRLLDAAKTAHPAASVTVPTAVRSWQGAETAYIEAVATYNARVAMSRANKRDHLSCDAEYQEMERTRRMAGALLRPMYDALSAAPASAQNDWEQKFKDHTVAVDLFLNELYAIMVDPCAEGTRTVQKVKDALITAAKRDRETAASPQATINAGVQSRETGQNDELRVAPAPALASPPEEKDT